MKRQRTPAAILVVCVSALACLLAKEVCPAADVTAPGEAVEELKADLDYAQVLFVEAIQESDGRWCVSARVRHRDEGWEHYANLWEVLDLEGNEIAWRALAHPHVHEQPFERDKCGITIPDGVTGLVVRARCGVHGFGGREVTVDLTVEEGNDFKVVRTR